jgi:predicted Zn finger-like uncharacterized protein
MDIVCPTCAAAYEMDAESLAPTGRKVRCAACSTVWRVFPSEWSAGSADSQQGANPFATEPEENILGEGGPLLRQAIENEAQSDTLFVADQNPGHQDRDTKALEGAGLMAMEEAISMQENGPASDMTTDPFIEASREEVPRARLARNTPSAKAKTRKAASHSVLSWKSASMAAALLVVGVGLHQREAIVRHLPQAASVYTAIGMPVNLRGIEIRNVASRLLDDNGVSVLVIDGDLHNITRNKLDVPRLRFAVRGADGQEVYVWSAQADKASLQAGENLNFRRRLAAPPGDGKDVAVRFLTRADTTAGIK